MNNSYQSSHGHFSPILRRQRQMQTFLPWSRIPAFEHREFLDKPRGDISCLCECVLLSDADSRAAVEREVLPAGTNIGPALRAEFVCVWSVDIFASVHGPDAVCDDGAFGHEDG